MRGTLIAVVVVVFLGFIASRISTNDYSITPGGAEPVAPLITINGQPGTTKQGTIFLTDVYLTPLTWLTYLPAWFSSSTDIISQNDLVEPGVSISELDAQGYLQMAQAKQQAEYAALTRLGYTVGVRPNGAIVQQVQENSPAWNKLLVADIVTGVNGTPTNSSCAVVAATHDLNAGTTVTLQVRKATISNNGTITNGSPENVAIKLGVPPKNMGSSPCPNISGTAKGFIGVAFGVSNAYAYPFSIQISTPNIGGPSAGLAMTLSIINQLSHGTLLHHHVLAATGTMETNGVVGDVGGVAQKTIAVANAGATSFLVPKVEAKNAHSTAPSNLAVVPIASLNQALNYLLRHGGSFTLANGSVESRASATSGS